MDNKDSYFGFRKVTAKEQEGLVKRVFSSVSKRYDLMNDIMSFGMHRLWKHSLLAHMSIRNGQYILDLATGTGDVAAAVCKQVPECNVVALDINYDMLKFGHRKLVNQGLVKKLAFTQASADCLPFPTNTFDTVATAFGYRNFADKELALAEISRVLKPGGRVVILEFSKPGTDFISKLYDFYSFQVIPKMGKLVARDKSSYQYLAESIRTHPDQKQVIKQLDEAGFVSCDYYNLTDGIVAIHKGFKV